MGKAYTISFNKESGSMEAKSLTLQLCPLTVIDVIIHCMRSIISMSIIFYNIIPLTSDLIHFQVGQEYCKLYLSY